jgi:hypothetical protein
MIGLGLGPTARREFLTEIVFRHPSISDAIADPEEKNLR